MGFHALLRLFALLALGLAALSGAGTMDAAWDAASDVSRRIFYFFKVETLYLTLTFLQAMDTDSLVCTFSFLPAACTMPHLAYRAAST